jgi:hypothetical protein
MADGRWQRFSTRKASLENAIATAVERGLIIEPVPMPVLTAKGVKSIEREMRPLLRDYVEILMLTGKLPSAAAMGNLAAMIGWH